MKGNPSAAEARKWENRRYSKTIHQKPLGGFAKVNFAAAEHRPSFDSNYRDIIPIWTMKSIYTFLS